MRDDGTALHHRHRVELMLRAGQAHVAECDIWNVVAKGLYVPESIRGSLYNPVRGAPGTCVRLGGHESSTPGEIGDLDLPLPPADATDANGDTVARCDGQGNHGLDRRQNFPPSVEVNEVCTRVEL